MEALNRDTELEQVTTAYFLEDAVAKLGREKGVLESRRPKRPEVPPKPVIDMPKVEREPYPQVIVAKPAYPKQWLLLAALCILVPVILVGAMAIPILSTMAYVLFAMLHSLFWILPLLAIYCICKGFSTRTKRREQEEDRIRNSPEYKKRCEEIDRRYQERCHERNREVEAEQRVANEKYQAVTMPAYENALKAYEESVLPRWERERNGLVDAIAKTRATLDEVYGHNVIPAKYRNLGALTFLASFMGTSQYDLRFAIERYDKEIDQVIAREHLEVSRAILMLTRNVLEQQQYSTYLQARALDYLENGNRLLRHTRNWAAAATALEAFHVLRPSK